MNPLLIKMTISPILRRCYLLIHTPVELGRPIAIHVARSCEYHDEFFNQYLLNAEASRKNGESRYLMSKPEIEKWTSYIPVGPRVQVVDFSINETQWGLLDWNNPIYNRTI